MPGPYGVPFPASGFGGAWRRTTSAASLLRKHARAVVCPAGANIARSPVSLRSTVAPRSQPRNTRCRKQHPVGAGHAGPTSAVSASGSSGRIWRRTTSAASSSQTRSCGCLPAGQTCSLPSFAALSWPRARNPAAPDAETAPRRNRACRPCSAVFRHQGSGRNERPAHNERRRFASPETRSCGCLPRLKARRQFARSPVSLRSTVAPRSQPRNTRCRKQHPVEDRACRPLGAISSIGSSGRLAAHNERRQFLRKHARAVVCPAGQACSLPSFAAAQLWPRARNPATPDAGNPAPRKRSGMPAPKASFAS